MFMFDYVFAYSLVRCSSYQDHRIITVPTHRPKMKKGEMVRIRRREIQQDCNKGTKEVKWCTI